jgi:hypothetical protein
MNAMVPVVKALIILDGDGNRLSSKYYAKSEFPTDVEQVGLFSAGRYFYSTSNAAYTPCSCVPKDEQACCSFVRTS